MSSFFPVGQTVQQASVTLTSAQVLAIFTTPVQVVPAPGAGLVNVPVLAVYNYTFKTTGYTDGGGSIRLTVGGIGSAAAATAGFWSAGSSQIMAAAGGLSNQALSAAVNQPVKVSQNTANPTLGDGTVTVTVYYVTLAAS